MITPQQIQEISFDKAMFGGYDMDSVDSFLEPLTEDYIALYKENSVLKSKMRILVEKLEEYRRQEGSMQNAILAAQKTCEQMTINTEKKCAQMLREAEQAVEAKTQNIDSLIGGEKERLELAKEAACGFIDGMQKRLKRQIELLEELRTQELLDEVEHTEEEPRRAFDFEEEPTAPTTQERADALIEEIGQNIELSIGAAEPLHNEIPKKFEGLQFGEGYRLGE